MTTVLIAHRWSGSPKADWYPWLKHELEKEGVHVIIPSMPDAHHPQIVPWVTTLQEALPEPDAKTYMIGHSIGCQALLRYIETLPPNPDIGGLLLVAPWTKLKENSYESDADVEIARPWIETPINWKKVFARAQNTRAIFSTNDPFVDYEKESHFFRQKLNADILIEENKGHFTSHDQIVEFPGIFSLIQKWGIVPEEPRVKNRPDSISDE